MMVLDKNNTKLLEAVVCSPSTEKKTEIDDFITKPSSILFMN